jgi:hypothetical protein
MSPTARGMTFGAGSRKLKKTQADRASLELEHLVGLALFGLIATVVDKHLSSQTRRNEDERTGRIPPSTIAQITKRKKKAPSSFAKPPRWEKAVTMSIEFQLQFGSPVVATVCLASISLYKRFFQHL